MSGSKKTSPSSGKETGKEADTQTDEQSGLAEFETSLDELETLVEQMESGDLSLEDSLKAFERGVALTRSCQRALKTAELRVAALTEKPDDS